MDRIDWLQASMGTAGAMRERGDGVNQAAVDLISAAASILLWSSRSLMTFGNWS
jgi:hypothetical protein